MSLTIRPLEPADKENWKRLWTGYLTFYKSAVDAQVYDVYFDRLLGDDPSDYSGFIALDGETPVGLTHYLFHRHGWKIEKICYLQDLWAEPSARGKGVGRALIEAVYAEADRVGAPSVYWLTAEDNAEARRLYDRIAGVTPFIKYQRR